MQLYELLIALTWSTLFGACLAYHFGKRSTRSEHQWQISRKKTNILENLCNQLIDSSVAYWSAEKNNENLREMEILEKKIDSCIIVINDHIRNHYPQNESIESCLKGLQDITADEFGKHERPADSLKVTVSMDRTYRLLLVLTKDLEKTSHMASFHQQLAAYIKKVRR